MFRSVALSVAVLLITSGAMAQEGKLVPIRTITVTGIAERKVVPDEAHVTVNLNTLAMKLSDAKSDHDKKLGKLMDIAKNMGIEEKKIATQSSTTQPIYKYERNPKTNENEQMFKGYRVQTVLDITVSNTKQLGELMDKVTNAGFEKGSSIEWGELLNSYYTVSNPTKLREEMLTEAMANAKAKATQLATAAGASIARVYQITEGSAPNFYQPSPPVPMMAMAKSNMAADMAAAAPPAGEQQQTSTVSVIYELQ